MHRFYDALATTRGMRFGTLSLAYGSGMAFALWLAYQLRFDFATPPEFQRQLGWMLTWVVAVKLVALCGFGQFKDSLTYFSTPDLKRILAVCGSSSAIVMAIYLYGGVALAPPRGVILADAVLSCATLCAGRLGLRFLRERYLAPQTRGLANPRRVAIIGAGDTGAAVVRELLVQRSMRPVAFFDDFRGVNSRLHGVSVWGPPERILDPKIATQLDEVIIALPSASPGRLRSIVQTLQKTGLPFRTIPSVMQLATGKVSVTHLRPVQIEDLLGRDVVQMNAGHVREMIAGRTILVTGAGGSIGSELCRQIASYGPCRLVLVERAEPALFAIEQELLVSGPCGEIVPCVADVIDLARMVEIFSSLRPQVVFHAAAHKHVPMMERQPVEAIRNNIFGTARVAELAHAYQAERFLFISTDKAINPTSVMGATKRFAEIFVQSLQFGGATRTRFMAVRFGNVLGSSGSVVPIFAQQIARGGPVTVTHPEVTRFFMTIPESVSLVLQSAAGGQGGEIFVLDMGRPVKILDLARQMIELNGLKPELDIPIHFTGLRPGEKLYEELSHRAENVTTTEHAKILRLVGEAKTYEDMKVLVKELIAASRRAPPRELKLLLQRFIPEYVPCTMTVAAADSRNERIASAADPASFEEWERSSFLGSALLNADVP